jgi:NAD(P)-dependent dehydrogenase (short-subunit alcohol dehydrogenase family)
MTDLAGSTALVVGAGRGVALALSGAGAAVVAVARSGEQLRTLAEEAPGVRVETADAADEDSATTLLARYRPRLLVLVAGQSPPLGPVHRLSWEAFSTNWQADVRIAFSWIGEALRLPLEPGSSVVVFSSGAALQGSPLSGGYAGSKATQRFLARYAQDESDRAGMGLRFATVLPRLTPATELGSPAVTAYAERGGMTTAQYLLQLGDPRRDVHRPPGPRCVRRADPVLPRPRSPGLTVGAVRHWAQLTEQLTPPRVSTQPVDRTAPSRRGDPAARVRRQPVPRPDPQRQRERVLDRVLCQVDLPEHPDHSGQRPAGLRTKDPADLAHAAWTRTWSVSRDRLDLGRRDLGSSTGAGPSTLARLRSS